MKILKKIITYLFFRPDMYFIFVLPLNTPSTVNYKNLLSNYFIYIQQKKIKKLIITKIRLLHKVYMDLLKIIYLPISLIFYLTNYRFAQVNYLQLGTLCHHLSLMTKYQFQKNKKIIIFVPKNQTYSFALDIFKKNKNIILIKNIFLYIISTPLIYTNFISCSDEIVDYYYDKNGKKIGKYQWSKIYSQTKFKDTSYFNLSNEYISKCDKIFQNNFGELELKNTFVLHLRENNYVMSSYIRNCDISNYADGLNFLIKKNYNIIKLVNSYDQKQNFGKNYFEINTDFDENKLLQFYLIHRCKGFICCNSGPAGIGLLLEKPLLQLNCVDVPYALMDETLYIPKIIKQNDDCQLYKNLWSPDKMMHYKSEHYAIKKNYQVFENSSDEILEAIKEFDILLNKKKNINFDQQSEFKKNIEYKSYGHSIANISPYFFNKHNTLFT